MKMFRKACVISAAALSIAGAAAAVPASAQAASSSATPARVSGLYLTLAPLPGYAGKTHRSYLGCGSSAGAASAVDQRCQQLADADGYVERIPPQHGPCYLIYSPVRATASGYWHGARRSYNKVFPNSCVAIRDTGGLLFRF
jgi:hypothetical protein